MAKKTNTPTFAIAGPLSDDPKSAYRRMLYPLYSVFDIQQGVTVHSENDVSQMLLAATERNLLVPKFSQLPVFAAFGMHVLENDTDVVAPVYVKVGKSTAVCVHAPTPGPNGLAFDKIRVPNNQRCIPASMAVRFHAGLDGSNGTPASKVPFSTWLERWDQADEERNEGETLAKDGKTDFEIMQEEERLNVEADSKQIIGDAPKKLTKKERQRISAQQKMQKKIEKKADKTRKAMKGAKKAAKRG